jgi:cytochrome c556
MHIKKVVPVIFVCLAMAACGGVDPDSPLGKRQVIFKQMMKTSEDLGGMLRGRLPFDAAAFAQGAQKLDKLAYEPWQHFPQVKDDDKTSARDDVWQRQARFQELAREMEAATGQLLAATTEPNLRKSELQPHMQRVEDACESCHKEFRNY